MVAGLADGRGPVVTDWAVRSERTLLHAAVLFRVGGLVQVFAALASVSGRSGGQELLLASVVTVESAVMMALWLRTRRIAPLVLAVDTGFVAAGLLVEGATIPPGTARTWVFFMYPFSLLCCVAIGVGYQWPGAVLAATTTLAAAYAVAAAVLAGDAVWNVAPNTFSFYANSVITWLVARELRRSGRSADGHATRALSVAAEFAREQETMRYGRMMHDRVLQTLEFLVRSGAVTDRDLHAQVMSEAAWLRDVITTGPPKGPGDLLAALQAVVHDQAQRGLRVELNGSALAAGGTRVLLPPAKVEAVCGAVREAVTNVGKHSGVAAAVVRVAIDPGGTLTVTILDQGRGFEPALLSGHPGTGLAHSVRGRITQVGGTVAVYSSPGNGTEVELSVPLPAAIR